MTESHQTKGELNMSIEETLKQEYNDRDANGKMLRLSNRVCNSEEKLRKELTEEQQELFRHFTEALDKHHMAEVDDALIYGFRYGISLINELKLIKM